MCYNYVIVQMLMVSRSDSLKRASLMSSTEFLEDLSSSETSDSRVTYNVEKI